MINEKQLLDFATPYYKGKDIMHDLWHIELVKRALHKIFALGR